MQTIGPPASSSAFVHRAALVCVAVLACSLPVLGRADPAGAAELCGGSLPAGQIRVAVIVDYGTEPDSPGTTSVRCLSLPDGAKGADLLRERAALVGLPRPRYAPSGLLCALDGYPAPPECAQGTGEVRYWSYWSGTDGSWVYGTGNPFTRRLRDGDIEGWRFVRATEANALPPRIAPDRAALFPPLAAPGPSVGPGAVGGGGIDPATGPDPAAPLPAAPGAGSTLTGQPGHVDASDGSAGDGSAGDGSAAAPDPDSTVTVGPVSSIEAAAPIGEAATSAGAGDGGLPAGAITGGIVIALVGAGALIRFRRSAAP